MKLKTHTRQFLGCLLAMTIAGAQTRDPISLPERLFGWADLHAHPVSHLAFGSDANGKNGPFLGLPGGKWEPNYSIDSDLPRCNFKHAGTSLDVVAHETHKGIMKNLDELGGVPHQTADFGDNNFGAPSFDHWPHPRSVSHQQMHVTQLRRAYEGGQRLMVASVTDNEVISTLWAKIGYNAFGNPVPAADPKFGFESAKKQLQAIKDLAQKNSGWMEIAYTAADARRIIKQRKLAVILGLEMDNLGLSEINTLVKDWGVRQVIPIHMVDNLFGGAAVYNDAFNSLNNFYWGSRGGWPYYEMLNDGFMKVDFDPNIDFRLGIPSYLRPEKQNIVSGGAMHIDPVPMDIYNNLGYKFGDGGHRNRKGLSLLAIQNPSGHGTLDFGRQVLRDLAKAGVLIDVSHMSYLSTRDTLDLVEKWSYPVMSSHTDLRRSNGTAHSERDLDLNHAKRIGALGGVIGLGTDWPKGFQSLISEEMKNMIWDMGVELPYFKAYYETGTVPLTRPPFRGDPEVVWLKIPMKTTGIPLTGKAYAVVTINGVPKPYQLNKFNEAWRPDLLTTSVIQLPANTRLSQLQSIQFKVEKGATWGIKDWDVLAVMKGGDPVATWLATFKQGLELLGGKGMAIGTDINGMAPQLWLPADDLKYPLHLAKTIGPAANTSVLQKARLGSQEYDFKTDGIAHYGMLPDFLEAVAQQPNASAAVQQLYHSVEDVVAMWEKCEAARANVK